MKMGGRKAGLEAGGLQPKQESLNLCAMEICLLENEESVLCHQSQLNMKRREDYSVSWYKELINDIFAKFCLCSMQLFSSLIFCAIVP